MTRAPAHTSWAVRTCSGHAVGGTARPPRLPDTVMRPGGPRAVFCLPPASSRSACRPTGPRLPLCEMGCSRRGLSGTGRVLGPQQSRLHSDRAGGPPGPGHGYPLTYRHRRQVPRGPRPRLLPSRCWARDLGLEGRVRMGLVDEQLGARAAEPVERSRRLRGWANVVGCGRRLRGSQGPGSTCNLTVGRSGEVRAWRPRPSLPASS